jgi:hypothetical protein
MDRRDGRAAQLRRQELCLCKQQTMPPIVRQSLVRASCLYATVKDQGREFGIRPRHLHVNHPCRRPITYRKHVSRQPVRDNLPRAMIHERLQMCVSELVASIETHDLIGPASRDAARAFIARTSCG